MKIYSTATISKSMTIKREKREGDDADVVIAHLKFDSCFVTREQIDFLVGIQTDHDEGWSRGALFDDLGAPRARLEIQACGRVMAAALVLSGTKHESVMHITRGTLKDVSLFLWEAGAQLSGELIWEVAGDEISEVEALLGKEVRVEGSLSDGGQADLLKAA